MADALNTESLRKALSAYNGVPDTMHYDAEARRPSRIADAITAYLAAEAERGRKMVGPEVTEEMIIAAVQCPRDDDDHGGGDSDA